MGNQRFSIIPARAVTDDRLTLGELKTLAVIGQYTDDEGWCFPSQSKIAEDTGFSRTTIIKHIANLKEYGYINVLRRKRENGSRTTNKMQVRFDYPPVGAGRHPLSAQDDTHNDPTITKELSNDNSPGPGGPETDLFGEKVTAPKKRRVNNLQKKKGRLHDVFLEESRLPPPPLKTKKDGRAYGERWSKPLGEILRMSDGDMELAETIIIESINRLRENDLTFDAPQSIIKTARSIYAQEYSEGGKHKTIRTDDGGFNF